MALSNKSIAILSVIALIVVILAGFIWMYNYSIMMQGSMNIEKNSINMVQGNGNMQNNMNMPGSMKTGGNTAVLPVND